jgi:hypothetical protein
MCRILSELENLAIYLGYKYKNKKERYFGYYASKQKNVKDIVNQIILQMIIFESSYKNFIKHNPNKEYLFPNNLSLKEIEEIVQDWKIFVMKKAKKDKLKDESYESYYEEFLNILKNNNLGKKIKQEFENIDSDSKNMTKEELRRVMNSGITASCLTNEKNKEIENHIMEKGDYQINVIIGGKREDNPFYKNTDKYDEKINKSKDELDKCLDSMLGYLELYSLLNASNNLNIHIKYINNIKDEIEKEILIKYEKSVEEFNKKRNKIYEEFTYEIPDKKINKIKADIEKWKEKTKDEKVKNDLEDAIKCICNNEEPMK